MTAEAKPEPTKGGDEESRSRPTTAEAKPEPTDGGREERPARRLDCRGLYCPLPVLRTERALARLAAGELLEVVATDPVAELDMAVFSQRSGHELLSSQRRGEELVFRFRRAAGRAVGG